MKKIFLLFQTLFCFHYFSIGQIVAIGNDRENIFYIGIDNPLTIAVEGLSYHSLQIQSINGTISGANGRYTFRSNQQGPAQIIISKLSKGKWKEIGRNYFRVKHIEDAIFKIDSGKDTINKAELVAQQFVRAELDGKYGFDLKITVDSFTICMISIDTCRYIERINAGNKISDEIRNEFRSLKSNDILIFKKIIVIGPEGKKEIAPRIIIVK